MGRCRCPPPAPLLLAAAGIATELAGWRAHTGGGGTSETVGSALAEAAEGAIPSPALRVTRRLSAPASHTLHRALQVWVGGAVVAGCVGGRSASPLLT